MTRPRCALSLVLAAAFAAPAAVAQELGVLDARATSWITQEVSGDAAYQHIRFMTGHPRPRAGADGLWRVAEYFAQKARDYGLQDVQVLRQASTTRPWNARSADLWIVGEEPERLASTLQTPVHLADFSRPADVTAELVDVGAGSAAELDAAAVAGKVVLTWGNLDQVMRAAVCERGAAGLLWYPSPFSLGSGIDGGGLTRPDQIRWIAIAESDEADCAPTFAFSLSLRQGLTLRERVAASSEPVRVHATVDAAFSSEQGAEPWQVMVEARIPGSDPAARQDVLFTGHLQEEATSANDDASGCASALEVARALALLIADGRLERPRRDLRFWWVTEISSERQYFADHPDAPARIWVNVNQDMVAANQAQDILRKQCVTRLPATRFHVLNDVMEAVVESMVAGNTFELAQLQNGIPLYPAPHLAHLGSRHRFNADVIFFHNNTDHMTFTEAPIGIPGVTFTNMPDRYIHSSDDDLWNVDATQLGRNAACVALIGYAMASAGPDTLPALLAETAGRGTQRLGHNLRVALGHLARTGADGYAVAADQLRYAVEREERALASLLEVDPGAGARLAPFRDALVAWETAAQATVLAAAGLQAPSERVRGEAETRLGELRPVLVGGPAEFLTGRSRIEGVDGLHPLMAFEALNAVDGRRTGEDIHQLVAAEAREAGATTYGTVTPDAVLAYLENVAATGLIRLD